MADISATREYETSKSEKETFAIMSEIEKNRFSELLKSGYGDTIGDYSHMTPIKKKKPLSMRLRDFARRIFGVERRTKDKFVEDLSEELAKGFKFE